MRRCAAWDDAQAWETELQAAGVPAQLCPADGASSQQRLLASATFAVVWKPPAGLLQACPNLKAVQSLGACPPDH